MLTRRALLGMVAAPVLAKNDEINRYGEIIYESLNDGKQITIIGNAHHTEEDVRDKKWAYVLESQKQTYELTRIGKEEGLRDLLLEGIWPDTKVFFNRVEACDPTRYSLRNLHQRRIYTSCLNAGLQFGRKNKNVDVRGWDDNEMHTLANDINMSDRHYATKKTMSRIRAGVNIHNKTSDIPYDVKDEALFYSFFYRSACLLKESMKYAPCMSIAGAFHLEAIKPWIERGNIAFDGVRSTVMDFDKPAINDNIDTTPYHFTLIQTHAAIELINQQL